MNGIKIVLDTNILLYLLSGDETLESFLEDKDLYISFINEMEVLSFHGITEEEKARISKLLLTCSVVEMNHQIKTKAIELRRKYRLKLPDSIVAATSWYVKSPLLSADKGLGSIEDIDLIQYSSTW